MPVTILDAVGTPAGWQDDRGAVHASCPILAGWLRGGVPGLEGVIDGDHITEAAVVVKPSSPWFGLALLDHFDRIGWTTREWPVTNAAFNPEQPRDPHGKWSDATGGLHPSVSEAMKHDPHEAGSPWGPRAEGKVGYGSVIFDKHGNVLLREPANHYDGYHWTFAKGGRDEGEHPAETAARETMEETGRGLKITGHVPGGHEVSYPAHTYYDHEGQPHYEPPYRSTAYFYLGRSTGHHPEAADKETWSTRWVTPATARKLISRSTNTRGRERDLKVLDAAVKANAALTKGK
jgi:8-oxo-dGTP diphosphatase